MDPFHQRLARVALKAAAEYGFCLAGGYAVQAHGFVDRVSKDVDLFTTMAAADHDPGFDPEIFAEALRAVRRFPDSAFEPYKLGPEQIAVLCARLLTWADEIASADR